jgi:hypothetical protein
MTVIPKAVRKGEKIPTACEPHGYVRRPAPADGLLFETSNDAFFVDAKRLRDELAKLPAPGRL